MYQNTNREGRYPEQLKVTNRRAAVAYTLFDLRPVITVYILSLSKLKNTNLLTYLHTHKHTHTFNKNIGYTFENS